MRKKLQKLLAYMQEMYHYNEWDAFLVLKDILWAVVE